jgi:hypothetical protein
MFLFYMRESLEERTDHVGRVWGKLGHDIYKSESKRNRNAF